jgi:hypothetical protein
MLVYIGKLYFGKDETFVLAVKLVYLDDMLTILY